MRKTIKNAFYLAFILPFILCFVIPVCNFLQNYTDFSQLNIFVCLTELSKYTVLIGALFSLIVLALSRFSKAYLIISAIIVAFAMAALIQSSFLNWNTGVLDGREIYLSKTNWRIYFEFLIWGLIFFFSLFLSLKNKVHLSQFGNAIYMYGILSILVNTTFLPKIDWIEQFNSFKTMEPKEGLYTFHAKNNTIMIILDTFQSDFFSEVKDKWPSEVAFLDGFTFYPNTLAGFPTTKASIPMLLTGQNYHNQQPFYSWLQSLTTHSIISFYHERQFNVNSVSLPAPFLYHEINKANDHSIFFSKDINHLLSFSVFRISPLVLKPYIFVNGHWKFEPSMRQKDLLLTQELQNQIQVNSKAKGEFKIFHFWGLHGPTDIDENFNFVNFLPDTRENCIKQTRGVLKWLNNTLAILKKKGVYDSSEIIIVGDHGRSKMPIDMNGDLKDVFNKNDLSPVKLGGSRPIFLYKPRQSTKKLSESNFPMHLSYLVCLLSNSDKHFNCDDYKLAKIGAQPARHYFYFNWDNSWKQDYLPKMRDYIVTGDVRDIHSWKSTNTYYDTVKSPIFPDKLLGKTLEFGNDSQVYQYIYDGWASSEGGNRWSIDKDAILGFSNSNFAKHDLIFKINMFGFVEKFAHYKNVDVIINHHHVAKFNVSNKLGWYKVTIPKGIINPDGLLKINFVISNLKSPVELGLSDDPRKLGICVSKIILDKRA